MALISCPECDRTISDLAQQCPGCGYPVGVYIQRLADERKERQARFIAKQKRIRKWRNRAIIAGIVILLVFVLILLPHLHG
jgi:uncharacterized membrane protein YvbJ